MVVNIPPPYSVWVLGHVDSAPVIYWFHIKVIISSIALEEIRIIMELESSLD
jgi:hypothetical protein